MSTDLTDDYLIWLSDNKGRAGSTIDKYRGYLSRLQLHFDGRDILDASREELEIFTGPVAVKQGMSGRSRRAMVAAVRGFYKWAASYGHIDDNPAILVEYPKAPGKLPLPITLENAERLIWAPDLSTFLGMRDAAMLALLIGCGIRVTGLVSLNQEDLIAERSQAQTRLIIRVKEKGGKERAVPVPREAQLLLQGYLGHQALAEVDRDTEEGRRVLFISTNNRSIPDQDYRGEARRLRRAGVWKIVRKYGEMTGVPPQQLRPHALRHLFGTELAEHDVDLLTRQALLGHADPKSTEIYTHLAMRKLMETTDRANPLSNMRTPVTRLLEGIS